MKPFTNHNVFSLEGDTDTTDMDVIQTMGLPESLAGTPQINEAAIQKVYKDNINYYLGKGYNQSTAVKMANQNADTARARVKAATQK